MSNKEIVLKALMGHKVEIINSPLGNEFVLDDEWLVEMDYDGAFAATIFQRPKSYKKKLVVFTKKQDEYLNEMLLDVKKKIMNAIGELQAA